MSADGRTAEEWGRVAVSLPGWRWMPGMQFCDTSGVVSDDARNCRVVGVTSKDENDRLWSDVGGEVWGALAPLVPTGARLVRAPHNGSPLFFGYMDGFGHEDGPWVATCRGGGSEWWPDPDDPATAGCLLALLGPERANVMFLGDEDGLCQWYDGETWGGPRLPLGRACIAAAEALGRWPGGGE